MLDKERIRELLTLLIPANNVKERIRLVAALTESLRPVLEDKEELA